MVNMLNAENEAPLRYSRANGNFLFLVIPNNVNWQSIPIAVIPVIFYRASILVFFFEAQGERPIREHEVGSSVYGESFDERFFFTSPAKLELPTWWLLLLRFS